MDDATKAMYQQTVTKLSTGSYWRAKDGENRIRLLPKPLVNGQPVPGMIITEIATHFRVGPDSKVTLCNKLAGNPCAICEFTDAQIAAGASEAVEPMQAQKQFEFFVLDLSTLDPNAAEYPAQIWAATPPQALLIMKYFADEAGWGDVSDPATGKICVVDKPPTKGAPFKVRFNPQPMPIDMAKVKYPQSRSMDSYDDQKAMLGIGSIPQVASPMPVSQVGAVPSPITPQVPQVAAPVPTPAAPSPVPTPASIPTPVAVAPVLAQSIATPPPTAPPVALPPTPVVEEPKFWIVNPVGVVDTQAKTASEVKVHLAQHGIAPAALQVMSHDRSSGWKTAADFGLGN